MKLNQIKLMIASLSIGAVLATNAQAQNQTLLPSADVGAAATQYWSLMSLKFDQGFENLTSKYNNYEASSIRFDRKGVEIRVFKSQICESGMLCPQLAEVTPDLVIKLQVRKVVVTGCYESFYASTPDHVKASIYEQIIVNRFMSERQECRLFDRIRDGYVHFKASGLSEFTGEKAEAHAVATLINVRKVNLVTIPEPTLPKQ